MSYLTDNKIASNGFMWARVAQAVVGEGYVGDADQWTYTNRRTWAGAPGWSEAWESALVSHPAPDPIPEGYVEYDPGADEGVITDGMILSQVQAMLTETP